MRNINRRKFLKKSAMGVTGLSLTVVSNPFLANGIYYQSSGLKSIRLTDNGKALINPDMGWTMHFYSNIIDNYGSQLAPSDTLDDFPGLSTIYLRCPWSFLELEEGKFNWELVDTPAQRWIDKGKKIAFRITAYESWMRYAAPEWVRNEGAKGNDVTWGGGNNSLWQPDFCDPVFLGKLENFISAMAARYDGSPHVAFVDIGSLGVWGEGHSTGNSVYCSLLEGQKRHIDLHCRHFKNSLLCISDDYASNGDPEKKQFPITDYAFSQGVTLRDDSIMVQPPPKSWFNAGMAQLFWPKMPVILEHEHYGSSKRKNAWFKELFLKSVEDYHASYMSIHWWPRILLEENRDVIDQINRRMGYRIQLREISWPEMVKLGEPLIITSSWANAGVAPCYPGGNPCITLKDDKGGIVSVLVDQNMNVKNLKVGKPDEAPVEKIKSTFIIAPNFKDPVKVFYRSAKPGDYDLYFSIGTSDGTPLLELPYEGNDGHKRYKLGKIKVADRET